MNVDLESILNEILTEADPHIEHNETVSQIEHVFRKHGFYTTREYPIYKIKDGSGRAGRIDLVARKGKFRVAVEYDHHALIKWKSFQKIVQIKPDVAIAISGLGDLKSNTGRAEKYCENGLLLYVLSLRRKLWIRILM